MDGGAWCLFSGWQWSRMGKPPGFPAPPSLLELIDAFVPREVAFQTHAMDNSIDNCWRADGRGFPGCLYEERGNGAVRTHFDLTKQRKKKNEVVTLSRDPQTVTADIWNFPVEFYSFLVYFSFFPPSSASLFIYKHKPLVLRCFSRRY